MEFTPQETKLIGRLRKQQSQWVWARWFCLALGVASVVLCAMFGFLLHSLVSNTGGGHLEPMTVRFIVVIWTKCCMYFFFAVCFLAMTWTKWHGDMNRTLLLKLLDAQQHEAGRDAHVN
jgi:hypothetical protein